VLVIDATTTGVTYEWSTGETTPTIQVSDDDIYKVTVDIKGCTDEDSIVVNTILAPEVNLGNDTTLCAGEEITLSIDDPTWDAVWSNGDVTSSITVSDQMTYSVRVENNGCDDEDEIVISTSEAPAFDLGEDIAICDLVGATLSIDLTGVDILWSTGETGTSINVDQAGLIEATVINDLGCRSMDEVNIIFRECQRFGLYQPTAFMPSASNPANSTFYVTPTTSATINRFEMNIYSRWGTLVYSSNDINGSWDGKINGVDAPSGVYVYAIEVNYTDDFDPNRTDIIQGDVTLVQE